jgi:adenosylcobyric acid synthase
LQWVRSPSELAGLKSTDWVILPGSKNTSGDLAWLRSQGLDAAIARHAGQGGAVLGVCGGLQMLGEALIDTHGIDGNAPGLGLLPLVTVFASDKTVRHTSTCFAADWCAHAVLPDDLGWVNSRGNVMGVYLHGLFEDAAVLQALFGAQLQGPVPTLETVFDGLADFVDAHFEPGVLQDLLN